MSRAVQTRSPEAGATAPPKARSTAADAARWRRQLPARLPTIVVLVAGGALVAALGAGHATGPAWAGTALAWVLALWWSAPRAVAPGLTGCVALAVATVVLAARGPVAAGWVLPTLGLGLAVRLLPGRSGWLLALGCLLAAALGSRVAPAAGGPAALPMLFWALALSLGALAGAYGREIKAHRRAQAQWEDRLDALQSQLAHFRFVLSSLDPAFGAPLEAEEATASGSPTDLGAGCGARGGRCPGGEPG